MDPDSLSWIEEDLRSLAEADLYRKRRVIEKRSPGRITVDGTDYLDVSSNDYLGLAADPRIANAAREAITEIGWGAGASPLVSGYTRFHAELERRIAEFEGTEAAIVFPSGFAANLGTISALVGPKDIIFSDRRNHASLIDGCRLSKAVIHLFDGQEPETLEIALREATSNRRRLIVTDAVFSMDGDIAPLQELADLADRSGAMLYVDEAHATGVLGAKGRGASELLGVKERVAIRMGTLSKALGGMGGFVAGSSKLCDWLVNRARPYIYSTGFPAAAAAAACRSLDIIETEPERARLVLGLSEQFRNGLIAAGLDAGNSQTPIIPIILGDASLALRMAERLREAGIWAIAIRPPTVPAGTARIRISLSAAHESSDIDRLLACVITAAKSL